MFKKILNYLIYLNFIIATSAGVLSSGVAHILDLNNHFNYGIFSFFSTLCVYNLQRLFKAKNNANTPWLKWVNENRKLAIFLSFCSLFASGYSFFKLLNGLTIAILVLMAIAVVISLFYVVRIRGKSIRETPHLKVHSIALTWTFIILLFPIINERINDWNILLSFIVAHYLYFIAVAIPFDIRDLKHDSPAQRTIPQVFGKRKAKIISISLFILAAIGIGITFSSLLSKIEFFIAILIQIFLVVFATNARNEIYFSGLIDGAIALLGLSYFSFANCLN